MLHRRAGMRDTTLMLCTPGADSSFYAKSLKPSRAWRPGPVLIGWNCISKRASLSRKVGGQSLVVYSFTFTCARCFSRDKTCSVAVDDQRAGR